MYVGLSGSFAAFSTNKIDNFNIVHLASISY